MVEEVESAKGKGGATAVAPRYCDDGGSTEVVSCTCASRTYLMWGDIFSGLPAKSQSEPRDEYLVTQLRTSVKLGAMACKRTAYHVPLCTPP